MILFKRNAKGDPISWSIHEWGQDNEYIVHYTFFYYQKFCIISI